MILKEVIARFGLEFDGKGLQQAQNGISSLRDNWKKAMGVLTGGAIAAGVGAFASSLADMSHELDETAQSLATSSEELYKWRGIADVAGVSSQKMEAALGSIASKAIEAGRAGAGTGWQFRRLGVQLRNEDGTIRSSAELFEDVGVKIAQMPDGIRKSRIAMQMFGDAGRAILPVFANGADGIRNYEQQIYSLIGTNGIGGFQEEARKVTEQQRLLKLGFDGLKMALGREILPVFANFLKTLLAVWQRFRVITENTKFVRAAFKAVGVAAIAAAAVMLPAFAPALATFGAIVASVLLLSLAIEDLTALFSGQRSAIGEWIDEIYGLGTAETLVGAFRLAWADLAETFEESRHYAYAFFMVLRDAGVGTFNALVAVANTFKAAWDGVFSAISSVYDAVIRVSNATRSGINTVKRFFGGGGGPDNGAAGGGMPNLPGLRAPVRLPGLGGAGSNTTNTTTTNNLSVTTSDPNRAAREALRLLQQQQADAHDQAQDALTPGLA